MHSLMFKVVPALIVVVFIAIIGFWITVGYFAIEGVQTIKEDGLKTVVHEIWEGSNAEATHD